MAAVKIYCLHYFSPDAADWIAQCDATCDRPLNLGTSTWHDTYETAIGHALLHHPREANR